MVRQIRNAFLVNPHISLVEVNVLGRVQMMNMQIKMIKLVKNAINPVKNAMAKQIVNVISVIQGFT